MECLNLEKGTLSECPLFYEKSIMREKVKSPQRDELKEIIEGIGGESRLKEILRAFYVRMSTDILIGFFFDGKDLQHIADQQAHFLLNAAGLRERFEGKGPSTAHVAMPPILSGHFDRRLVILRETLAVYAIQSDLAECWVRFEESFRKVIVSE